MDGILLINKPVDHTSHDVVAILRGILKTKKIGHAGTLDPMATGLLVMCINKGTKIVEYLTNNSKVYEATITIGFSTNTLDSTGEILNTKNVLNNIFTESIIDSTLDSFIGEYSQLPPMFSAIKHKGKKLYEYARKGIEIERKERLINISSIKRTSDITYNNNMCSFNFIVDGSKGIYIRTLCEDIGARLNYPSHMSALTRIKSGVFNLCDAYTLDDVSNGLHKFISISKAIEGTIPKTVLSDELIKKVKNGIKLNRKNFNVKTLTLIVDSCDKEIALYDIDSNDSNLMKAVKVF